ncbi:MULTISPECIES: GNAT family N-acetyltransferase [unclassified Microbacterium]|uniref:GNAT family N-acetyltransferase n=1 Tax=unclassified Microbacterium TaxID=2609290 RepID=UPI00214B7E92|nr:MULTISPECIES: GNAT family N-acetyltransferase [unclassified Microbacterium]MCR2785403.1 GNAT family N-acetyltransferase [Microbacterium sp. zg.B96]WIM14567.1 GNAT family N-acetyltransferase [Microbacterium sp. zg-B96]
MTSTALDVEFRPLIAPGTGDPPDEGDFAEMVRVRNTVYREVSGHDDESITPAELRPHYDPDPDQIRYVWLAVVDGEVVGRIGVDIPLAKGSRSAFWLIELLREVWGRGIGTAAYALVEDTARTHGRTVLQSWAMNPAADGPMLAPPTGFGSIPHDNITRFYLRHGYTLEQVDRSSILDLTASFDGIERLLAQAKDAASGYRVVQWHAPTPAEYREGYAWMKSRMSTDAPAAALEFDEEAWDADRVARHDAKYTAAGRTMLVTAAQHIATGELCAFNELVIGPDHSLATQQEDTLVLKEHRGHRLGTLVKCAGLMTWRELMPDSPRVLTYNAEENRPMLDINEGMGFVPVAYEGGWKKVLSA